MDARHLAGIALGGALGALARYGVAYAMARAGSSWVAFPWPTLAVNVLGSFALGVLFLGGQEGQWLRPGVQFGVGVGFLGAFTTLSTFSVETIQLWERGRQAAAAGYVVATSLGGPAAALLGWRVAQMWT